MKLLKILILSLVSISANAVTIAAPNNLTNFNFNIIHISLWSGACSYGPDCYNPYGWKTSNINSTSQVGNYLQTTPGNYYTTFISKPVASGGYSVFYYNDWIQLTKTTYNYSYLGSCNKIGGRWIAYLYTATGVLIKPIIPMKTPVNVNSALVLNYGTFTVPVNAKYMKLHFQLLGPVNTTTKCNFDNINPFQ